MCDRNSNFWLKFKYFIFSTIISISGLFFYKITKFSGRNWKINTRKIHPPSCSKSIVPRMKVKKSVPKPASGVIQLFNISMEAKQPEKVQNTPAAEIWHHFPPFWTENFQRPKKPKITMSYRNQTQKFAIMPQKFLQQKKSISQLQLSQTIRVKSVQ